ncbi:MAG: M14 family zinc carboxypeptidase [Cyclobacteriaceae bacterium]
MKYQRLAPFILLTVFCFACEKQLSGESYDPEGSTDTESKPINYQVRRTWRMDEGRINFSNEFTGARLNEVTQISDTVFNLEINPENEPINKSPWYAFSVWAEDSTQIALNLSYFGEYGHRYYPDFSTDLVSWQPLDSSRVLADTVAMRTTMILDIGPDTLYIGAQEIMTSEYVYETLDTLAENSFVSQQTIGYSTLGKPIPLLKIGNEDSEEVIVILGRQHPPEATGFLALQAFVGRLTSGEDSLAREFRNRFLILMVPMLVSSRLWYPC